MHQRTSGDEYSSQYQKSISANKAAITVDLAHVGEYDTALLDLLLRQPASVIPPLETAAVEALKTLLNEKDQQPMDQNNNDEGPTMPEQGTTQEMDIDNDDNNNNNNNNRSNRQDVSMFHGSAIQILIKGNLAPTPLRSIQSKHLNTLVRCTGIVISAAKVKSRATTVHLRCSRCQHETTVHATSGPFGSILLPQRCLAADTQEQDCGPSPYSVVPDSSKFVDQQTLKLQEAPENGEKARC